MANATHPGATSARAPLAIALTLLLGLALLVAVPARAEADEGAVVERVFGPDRFATAAAISERTFTDPSAVDIVYWATGLDWADALAAGAIAADAGAPVLLSTRTTIPDPILAELERLDPERVVIVGGEAAVGREVEEQLRAFPSDIFVERIGGTTRFDTAARLATDAFPEGADAVYLGTGQVFADVLSGVPAAALQGSPVVLATRDTLPEETARAITELDPAEVVVLGGEVAISQEVAEQIAALGPDVTRISGPDRYATADAVATSHFLGVREVFIATGEGAPDALAGGAAVAHHGGALLLAARGQLMPSTAQVLRELNPRRVTLLGGTAALQAEVEQQVREAVRDVTSLRSGQIPDLIISGAPTMQHSQALYAATAAGRHEVLSNPPRGYADISASWSPDGRWVAFNRITTGGAAAAPSTYVMDFQVGQGSETLLYRAADCDGSVAPARWRTGAGAPAVLVRCLHGQHFDPERADLTVIGMDGSERPVVPPTGVTYADATWSPSGQLTAIVRDGDAYEVRVLDEQAWTTGGAGTLVTDQVDNSNIMWESVQGGDVLFHHETDSGEQRLHATIEGATEEIFAGAQEDSGGQPWEIWDTHPDLGVMIISERGGDGRTKGVADIVAFDGSLTSLVGPNDYEQRRANLIDVRFLPDGERVVVGESRLLGERDAGVRSISDGQAWVHNLETGARERLLGSFVFLIPEAVHPVGG